MASRVLGLVLLTASVGASPAPDDPVQPVLGKPDLALVVKVRVPRDERYAKVWELLEKIKERGATHLIMQIAKAGEGASAEVVAQPQTATKRVTAIVGELLERGITKIVVEVKK